MADGKIKRIDGARSAREAAAEPVLDNEVLGSLNKLVRDLGSTLDLDEVLRDVAAGLKEQIGYDTFAILLVDELGQQLRFRFTVGYRDDVEDWVFGLGQGIVGTSAAKQQVVKVGDVREEVRYINAERETLSELAVPLVVKGRTIGVLDVGSSEAHHFTETHEQLLTFLAGHLANGIENARLYESVREQARTLSLMHEVTRDLTSILDREKLLQTIARLVKRLIDYQLFSVMIWNEEDQILDHTFQLRFDKRFTQKGGFKLSHGVTGTAAALRQPLRVPNVHLNPHYTQCGHGVEVRSELAIPLVFKDRLIGVMDLESVEYNAFTEQHEQMLSTLGSYVAVALENARLYEKVVLDEQRLEGELQTAREIQKGLLPRAPRVPGATLGLAYEPARQLGGDFYDFPRYGNGRQAIAVGDAAGKGTAAALHGSMAIGVLRGHVVEHPCDPASMLKEMNQQLRQSRLENRFVAMVYAIYDSRDRSLIVANAGFSRPQLVRAGQVQELQLEGVPLGLLPDIEYDEMKLALEPGDVLVFTSDGINESMNRDCEEFGARKMRGRLVELSGRNADEIAEGLMRSSRRFEADADDADDRTIVVLKVD